MAAAATPDPPATTMLRARARVGYSVTDQRWRLHAACAGIDPEVFLPTKGETFEEALSYCCRCDVRTECLQAEHDVRAMRLVLRDA